MTSILVKVWEHEFLVEGVTYDPGEEEAINDTDGGSPGSPPSVEYDAIQLVSRECKKPPCLTDLTPLLHDELIDLIENEVARQFEDAAEWKKGALDE